MSTLVDLTQAAAQVDDMRYCVTAIGQLEAMFKAIWQASKDGDARQIQSLAKIGIQLAEMESNHLDSSLEHLRSLMQETPSIH